MKTTVSEKGQITIPGRLRKRLGIRRGTVLNVSEEGGRLVFEKASAEDAVARAYGLLAGQGQSSDALLAEMRDWPEDNP